MSKRNRRHSIGPFHIGTRRDSFSRMRVGSFMSVVVLEPAEAVDAEDDDCELSRVTLCAMQLLSQRFLRITPGEKSCQGVADSETAKRVLQPNVLNNQSDVIGNSFSEAALFGEARCFVRPRPR